jgi:hypothetical protein
MYSPIALEPPDDPIYRCRDCGEERDDCETEWDDIDGVPILRALCPECRKLREEEDEPTIDKHWEDFLDRMDKEAGNTP